MLAFFKEYGLFVFLTFCLLASSSPLIPNGLSFYLIGILCCFIYCIRFCKGAKGAQLFCGLLVACYLASLVNSIFDYRLFVYTIVIITC